MDTDIPRPSCSLLNRNPALNAGSVRAAIRSRVEHGIARWAGMTDVGCEGLYSWCLGGLVVHFF